MRSDDVQPLNFPPSGERGPVAPARRTDELDRGIIEALQANGRESFRAIAARVGVSEATVRARYGRLTAEGILQVVAVTNPLGLGYEQALVGVKTSGSPEKAADAIARWPEAGLRHRDGRAVRPRRRNRGHRPASPARPDEPAPLAAGRRLDRDLRVPGDVEAALRLGEWNAKGGNNEMSITQSARSAEELGRMANDHLWLHFTRMGGYDPPIIVRGDGCYLEDAHGKRYLDALAGLFSVNLGYGYGEEIGQAALEQMRELPFYTNWSYAHPRAIELASEIASLAPGDLNRVFFVNGGSEAVEAGVEARAPVLPGARHEASAHGCRQARRRDPPRRAPRLAAWAPLQGDCARGCVPRHDLRRSLDQRHRLVARSLRAARSGGAARLEYESLPPAAGRDGGAVHGVPDR